MNPFSQLLQITRYEWFTAIRSRRALVILLLYMSAAICTMNFAINALQKMEQELVSLLQLPETEEVGVVSKTLWKSKPFQRIMKEVSRDTDVYNDLVGKHPVELIYAWLVFFYTPLLVVLVYLFGLRSVLQVSLENYPLFLGVGLLHWQLLASVMQGSCNAVTANANLVGRANFPRVILPLAAATTELIVFALTLVFFLVLLYPWIGGQFWWGLVLYPLGMGLHIVFLVGLALACSAVQVLMPNFRNLVAFGLALGFWLSPVIYASTRVSPGWRTTLFLVNPAVAILDFSRNIFYDHRCPPAEVWGMLVLWATLIVPGTLIFRQLQKRFADEL